MGNFNLLEAKVMYTDKKEILTIKGQLTRQLVKPFFHMLITDIKVYEEGVTAPFKQGDTISYHEFTDKLYELQFSLSKYLKYPDVETEIKYKRAESEVD
jgi:hypothetical protein